AEEALLRADPETALAVLRQRVDWNVVGNARDDERYALEARLPQAALHPEQAVFGSQPQNAVAVLEQRFDLVEEAGARNVEHAKGGPGKRRLSRRVEAHEAPGRSE